MKKIVPLLNKIKKKEHNPNIIDNIFDYYKVMEKRPYWEETFLSNDLYGISYCLKRYTGYSKMIQCAIEHGMPHTFDNKFELVDNQARILLVASDERKRTLRDYTQKQVIPFGPIIAYSEPLLSDNIIKDIKNNLGKTLLIYPMHSIEDYHFQDTAASFISYVEDIKQRYSFDTVLVSMYFIDIQRGLHIRYLQKGWQIVCAGNRLNYDFMDCQRTIMELADTIVCQGYSSALGYAGYLKKKIIYKDMPLVYRHGDCIDEIDMWGEYKEKIVALFSDYQDSLTDEQYSFLNYLYGYDSVKTPEELKGIFEMSESTKRRNIFNLG